MIAIEGEEYHNFQYEFKMNGGMPHRSTVASNLLKNEQKTLSFDEETKAKNLDEKLNLPITLAIAKEYEMIVNFANK